MYSLATKPISLMISVGSVHFYRSLIEIAVAVSILTIVKVLTKTVLSSNLVFGMFWLDRVSSIECRSSDRYLLNLIGGDCYKYLKESRYGFDRLFGQSRVCKHYSNWRLRWRQKSCKSHLAILASLTSDYLSAKEKHEK
jgi:hypothetical protein